MKLNQKRKRILGNIGSYTFFVTPAVILIAIFVYFPLSLALYYSTRDWNGISVEHHFVGLKNYINVFKEKAFITSFGGTFKYMLVCMIIVNLLAFLLALALNSRIHFRTFFRGVYFMPMVISSVVVGYLWNVIIARLFPMIGEMTGWGLFVKKWLAYPDTAFAAVVLGTVWQTFGYQMMIYLTGLQGIPNELLEAASIDGADSFKRLTQITLPLLRPTFTICIFLSLVNGLKAFDMVYSLTSGGPYGTTTYIALQIYLDAFKRDMLSYASAKAIIFCIIIAAISFLQVALMKRKEVEM